ncbi:MAG: hypothetical protein ABIU54_12575 [Candidatus Eisenbacteria bacterium]
MILTQNGPVTNVERIGLAIAMILALALMWPVRGYLTDDTFIHLQYARNLAAGQGFVFNPGEHVYGSTSPLWVALLADGIAVGLDGVGWSKAMGFAATLWSVGLFLQLMRRNLRMPELRALATIVWASHAWMIRWSLSGMETPLAVALVLAGFVAFTEGEQWGSRPLRTGSLWALAALTRPEAVFLLVLWGVFLVIDTDSRDGVRRLFFGVVPPVLIYGGWLLFARVYFGTFWPNTLAAKAAGGEGWAYYWATFVRQVGIVGLTDAVLAGALIAALVFGGGRLWPRRFQAQRMLPWVWVTMVPVLYILRGVPVLSRYLLPILPILSWLAWRAVERWWGGNNPDPGARRGAAVLGVGLAALALTQNLFAYNNLVLPQVRSWTTGMHRSLIPWAEWFAAHTPPHSVIAARDIGALGFYSHRRVVDLAGLVTPKMVPILQTRSLEDATADFSFASFSRPDFLVDCAPRAYDLISRSRYATALVPLGNATVPNLGIARPGEAVYSYYRIDWAVHDSLGVHR